MTTRNFLPHCMVDHGRKAIKMNEIVVDSMVGGGSLLNMFSYIVHIDLNSLFYVTRIYYGGIGNIDNIQMSIQQLVSLCQYTKSIGQLNIITDNSVNFWVP